MASAVMFHTALTPHLTRRPRCVLSCLSCLSCRGRNLTWQTNMGTVDLKGMFDKRYEFSVRRHGTPTTGVTVRVCRHSSVCGA